MNSIRVGIVGCGKMGKRHADAIKFIKQIQLVGCTDIDEKKSTRLAQSHNIKSYDSLESLLNDDKINAVIICTPNIYHKTHVISSLKAEKHVLVEKPLAINISECEEIISHAKKLPHLKVMVGQTHRFYPHNLKVKELINRGMIGLIKYISEYSLDPGFIAGKGKTPKWIFKKSMVGNALMDTVHAIDKVRWLTDSEFKSVYTSMIGSLTSETKAESMGSITFTLKNNAIFQLFFLSPSWGIRDQSTRIVGTRGVIHSTYGESVTLGKKNWKEFDFYGKHSPPSFEHNLKGFQNELSAFANSIKKDEKPPVTIYDGKKSVEVVMAIIQSYQSRKIISLR